MSSSGETGEASSVAMLSYVLRQLWAGRWWIIVSTLLLTGGAVAYALMTPRVYRVATILAPASDTSGGGLSSSLGQLGQLASLAGVSIGKSGNQTAEALTVAKSTAFTEALISDLAMMPKLFPYKWDAVNGRWKGEQKTWPTLGKGAKLFDKQIRTVEEDRKTGLVTLAIEWNNPKEAEIWSAELIKRLNAEMRQRALASADSYLDFLNKRLATANVVEVREAISRLIEAQLRQQMIANVEVDYAFRVIDRGMAPDLDDAIWPKKRVIAIAGFLLGAFMGCVLALIVPAMRSMRGGTRGP